MDVTALECQVGPVTATEMTACRTIAERAGDRRSPTLAPSLHRAGRPCRHGCPPQRVLGEPDGDGGAAAARAAAAAGARMTAPAIFPAIALRQATLRAEGGTTIVGPVDWTVAAGERWVVLGPNGSGKTSLLRLAGAERRPSSGTVDVLGQRLGRVDMRELRARIGVASVAVADQLRPTITAADAVVSARHGALEAWWHDYDDADRARAFELLDFMGCASMGGRQLVTLSQGERQRVLLARALMARPEVLLLDEPAAGLDLPARELLVDRLRALAEDPAAPTMVLVTHHVEEIPVGITHALLLAGGRVVATGPLETTLTPTTMSQAFGLSVVLEHRLGRWAAWGRGRPT